MRIRASVALLSSLLVASCEHPENYRWSSDTPTPTFVPMTPPPGSVFKWQARPLPAQNPEQDDSTAAIQNHSVVQ